MMKENLRTQVLRKILVASCLFMSWLIFSQTPVTYTVSPTSSQINTNLAGANVVISNGSVLMGKTTQIATFTNGLAAGLKMDKGVYFSTGLASVDLSKKNSYVATSNFPTPENTIFNDPDLLAIDPNAKYNVISYEFTIKLANTVSGLNIAYQFGSEEYPDYVGSVYNDSFGFFISGPGISGKINMGKLPNGKVTSVNTINAGIRGTNAQGYPDSTFDPSQSGNYINNGHTRQTYYYGGLQYYYQNPQPQPGPFPVYVEHNGISKIINYSIRNLIPGGTYTFKIIIGDSSDAYLDSGVFIQSISAFADLNANDDSYQFTQGTAVTTPTVFANDTSNGNTISSNLVSVSSNNLPAGFTLNADGTITIANSVQQGQYIFDYTICDKSNPIYCKTAKVTINITAPPVCYKSPGTGGTVLESKHGITSLGRAGAENGNWPMVRKGAHTVLESKTKGFVINRLTTNQKNNLTPAVGMIVYDKDLDCLSIYDGVSWKCYSKQICPN